MIHLNLSIDRRQWVCISVAAMAVFSSLPASAARIDDFFVAIKRDDPQRLTALLRQGADPNSVNAEGQTGLYEALRDGSLATAMVLVNWPKTDVNRLNARGESALMLACLQGHEELAEKIIKRGGDINKTGWTPLHYAATSGHLPIMQRLLSEYAYIDAESPNGTTPLMMAARYGTTLSVKLLIDEGADVSLKNSQGLSALAFAEQGERPDAIGLIQTAIARKPRPRVGKPAS